MAYKQNGLFIYASQNSHSIPRKQNDFSLVSDAAYFLMPEAAVTPYTN